MKILAVIVSVAVATLLGCAARRPPFNPATSGEWLQPEPPIGRLGYRIGTYLTIEGVRASTGKGGHATLLVDKVNAYELKAPIGIRVDHFTLPATGRCILKGFETGMWVGIPFYAQLATNAESATPIPRERIEVEQGPWQFVYSFRVLSVVEPKPGTEKP